MESLAAFERGIRQLMAEVEQEMVGEGLSQFDIDAPVEEVDGRRYRQVYRGDKRCLSAAGEVRVERSLYHAKAGEKAMCRWSCGLGWWMVTGRRWRRARGCG